MDAWFIAALITALLTLAAVFVRRRVKKPAPFNEPKPTRDPASGQQWNTLDHLKMALEAWAKLKMKHDNRVAEINATRALLAGFVGFLGAMTAFFFVMSMFVLVGTNKVGIMTEAGKPTSAYSNGFHTKKPWAIKTEFDGTRQFLRFDGQGNNEESLEKKIFPCIKVKLDGQATACLSGTVAWQMKADTNEEKKNAIELFRTYRTFERLTKNFVYTTSRVAFGVVFSNNNPLVEEKNQSLSLLNEMSLAQLRKEFNGELNIMSVDLAVPDYDEATDKSIADVQAQKAKTRLANEEEQTNIAKAKANKELEQSVQDPRVNQANCIQAAKEMNKEPGYCMMGDSDVIVNTDK